MSNQRTFFTNLQIKFGINKPSDWANITASQVMEEGGETLLKNYYDSSLQSALRTIFPGKPFPPKLNENRSYLGL